MNAGNCGKCWGHGRRDVAPLPYEALWDKVCNENEYGTFTNSKLNSSQLEHRRFARKFTHGLISTTDNDIGTSALK